MSVVFHAVRRNFSMLNSCLRICSGLPGSKIDFRSNWHLKLWWFTSHLKEYGSLSFYLAASAVYELRVKIQTLHCGQKQKEKNFELYWADLRSIRETDPVSAFRKAKGVLRIHPKPIKASQPQNQNRPRANRARKRMKGWNQKRLREVFRHLSPLMVRLHVLSSFNHKTQFSCLEQCF